MANTRRIKKGFWPKRIKEGFWAKGIEQVLSTKGDTQSSAHSNSSPNPNMACLDYSNYLASNFIKNWFNLKPILDYA